eukprot:6766506-Karenia_brevis.AAC.1
MRSEGVHDVIRFSAAISASGKDERWQPAAPVDEMRKGGLTLVVIGFGGAISEVGRSGQWQRVALTLCRAIETLETR